MKTFYEMMALLSEISANPDLVAPKPTSYLRPPKGIEPDTSSHNIIPVVLPRRAVGLFLSDDLLNAVFPQGVTERPAVDLLARIRDSGDKSDPVSLAYASNAEFKSLAHMAIKIMEYARWSKKVSPDIKALADRLESVANQVMESLVASERWSAKKTYEAE